MGSMMEWFLEKMSLTETEDEEETETEIVSEAEAEEFEGTGFLWIEKYLSKKTQEDTPSQCIFCKKVMTYDDAREVIREYKKEAECVIIFEQSENSDSQGMMNYICGGIFALEGSVREVGGNVFVVSHGTKLQVE